MTREQQRCGEQGHGFVGKEDRRWCFWCGFVEKSLKLGRKKA